jgi:diguanylate cyclase (GGDEF)-like protein
MPEPRPERETSRTRETLVRGYKEGMLAGFRLHPDATLELAPDGTILRANPKVEALLGKTAEELKGKHITKVVPPHANAHVDHTEVLGELSKTAPGQAVVHPLHTTVQLAGPRGRPLEAYLRFIAYRPMGSEHPTIFAHLTHTEPILKESKLFENILNLNADINAHEDLKNILPRLAQHLGERMRCAALVATVATPEDSAHHLDLKPGNELIIRAMHGFDLADFAPHVRFDFGKGLLGAAAAHRTFTRVKNLQEYPTRLPELAKKYKIRDAIAIPLLANGARPGEEPALVGVIGLFKHEPFAGEEFADHEVKLLRHVADNAATKIYQTRLSDRLRYLADHDDLTHLHNRGRFFRTLREYLQLRRANGDRVTHALKAGESFGLVYADADNLKALNDAHGHTAGNLGLVAIGRAFQRAARKTGLDKSAVLARLGGDEYGALLPGASPLDTQKFEAEFQRTLQRYVSLNTKFKRAEFGASTARTTFVTEGKSDPETHVVNIKDLEKRLAPHAHAAEENYLDAVLADPEVKVQAPKAATKRKSGYIHGAFQLELAEAFRDKDKRGQPLHLTLAELQEMLGRHANIEPFLKRLGRTR